MPDSSLVEFDNRLANEVTFNVLEGKGEGKAGGQIHFQFPPKVLTDVNTSAWQEHEIWAIELLRIHKGSVGKRLTVEFEYVATDKNFTGAFIAKQLRTIKAYFFKFTSKRYPVVLFKYGNVIPEEAPFRLRDLSIQHGPELVRQDGEMYPLHTKVVCTLELATSAKSGHSDSKDARSKVAKADKVNVNPVKGGVKPMWW